MSRPTGKELCLAAQQRLEAAGIADSYRDASLLFMHALCLITGEPIKDHYRGRYLAAVASPELEAAYRRMIDARATRQPVSQITGRRAFWEHEFIVTRDTLDPRPETETLVEEALKLPWHSVLDLGVGTGAILISLLSARPGSVGTGTDISEAALDVARRNAHLIGVTARLAVSDWFSTVNGRFDLIVSNPPYIALDEMAGLAPEVGKWEPRRALTDGADGLSAYRVIAGSAAGHLTPHGHVLVEIGHKQGEAVATIFRSHGAETRCLTDLDGRDRVILARF